MKKYKILISLIDNRAELLKPFVSSLIGLYDYTQKYHDVSMINVDGNFIDQMRNEAAKKAIEGKYDYIFMVDTDQIYPKDSIIRLLGHNKDIIGGKYYRRKYPHYPTHFKKVKMALLEKDNIEYFPKNNLKKVGASGMGGVLIKTKVFKKLKYPYFEVRYSQKKNEDYVGEDIDFCFKIKGKFNFWIDPTLVYPHITQVAITNEKEFKEIL